MYKFPIPKFKRQVVEDFRKDGYWIEAVDINGDSKPDIVGYGLGEGEVNWYRNNDWKKTLIAKYIGPVGMHHADITADGRNDIVICYEYGQTMINCDLEGGLLASDWEGKAEYREVVIRHSGYYNPSSDNRTRTRKIRIERKHDNYTPPEKYFFIAILHDPSELPVRDVNNTRNSSPLQSISIDERQIPSITNGNAEERAYQLTNSQKNAWYYNEDIDISFIKVFDNSSSISISAEYF